MNGYLERVWLRDVTCPAVDLLKEAEKRAMVTLGESEYLERVDEGLRYQGFRSAVGSPELMPSHHPSPMMDPSCDDGRKSTSSNRATLVLDVDNTLIFCKHVSDEVRVSDHLMYGGLRWSVHQLTFELGIRPLDVAAAASESEIIHVIQVCSDNLNLPSKDAVNTYTITQGSSDDGTASVSTKKCTVVTVTLTKLSLEPSDERESTDISRVCERNTWDMTRSVSSHLSTSSMKMMNQNKKNDTIDPIKAGVKYHDFLSDGQRYLELSMDGGLDEQIELLAFERGPVDFIHKGFRVRMRPGLVRFLHWCSLRFRVILFTAAQRDLYTDLLAKLHRLLIKQAMDLRLTGVCNNSFRFWKRVFFRDNCKIVPLGGDDDSNSPYRTYFLKHLFEMGLKPSKVILVDNNVHMFRGMEPNCVSVRDYYGRPPGLLIDDENEEDGDEHSGGDGITAITTEEDSKSEDRLLSSSEESATHWDRELMEGVLPILQRVVDSKHTDVRYPLNEIEPLKTCSPSTMLSSTMLGGSNDQTMSISNNINHNAHHFDQNDSKMEPNHTSNKNDKNNDNHQQRHPEASVFGFSDGGSDDYYELVLAKQFLKAWKQAIEVRASVLREEEEIKDDTDESLPELLMASPSIADSLIFQLSDKDDSDGDEEEQCSPPSMTTTTTMMIHDTRDSNQQSRNTASFLPFGGPPMTRSPETWGDSRVPRSIPAPHLTVPQTRTLAEQQPVKNKLKRCLGNSHAPGMEVSKRRRKLL